MLALGKLYVWRKQDDSYEGKFPVWDIKWEFPTRMSEYRPERTEIDRVPENTPFIILAVEHDKRDGWEERRTVANLKVLTANGVVGWMRINLGSPTGYSIVPVED